MPAGVSSEFRLSLWAFVGHSARSGLCALEVAFYFTPYLWVSGVSGTTSTSNPNIPSQTATASFGNLLSHINSIPLIGASELRYERFGLLADLMVVSLKSDITTKDVAFSGGSTTVTQLISTIMPAYRVVEASNQFLDLGVGTRIIGIWTTLSFDSGLLPGFSRSASVRLGRAIDWRALPQGLVRCVWLHGLWRCRGLQLRQPDLAAPGNGRLPLQRLVGVPCGLSIPAYQLHR